MLQQSCFSHQMKNTLRRYFWKSCFLGYFLFFQIRSLRWNDCLLPLVVLGGFYGFKSKIMLKIGKI